MQLESINGHILALVTKKCCFINGHLLYGLCLLNGGEVAQTGGLWKYLPPDCYQPEKFLVVTLLQVINIFHATTYTKLVSNYTAPKQRGVFLSDLTS